MHWLSFLVGALLGWLICWLIDVLCCRRRRMAAEARLQSKLKVCTEDNAALQAQLAGYRGARAPGAADAEASDLRARLDSAYAELEALRGRLADLDDLRADARGWETRAAQQGQEIERLQAELAASAATRAPQSALAGMLVGSARSGGRDNLIVIEGIGPKISALLADAGIVTFAQLAEASVERLRELLTAAGPRYALADPTSWPQQAALARDGQWEAFQALLDSLRGGRSA